MTNACYLGQGSVDGAGNDNGISAEEAQQNRHHHVAATAELAVGEQEHQHTTNGHDQNSQGLAHAEGMLCSTEKPKVIHNGGAGHLPQQHQHQIQGDAQHVNAQVGANNGENAHHAAKVLVPGGTSLSAAPAAQGSRQQSDETSQVNDGGGKPAAVHSCQGGVNGVHQGNQNAVEAGN